MHLRNIIPVVAAVVIAVIVGVCFDLDEEDSQETSAYEIEGVQLPIFGNADGDSDVDYRDVSCIRKIIASGTEGTSVADAAGNVRLLADADQDGDVDTDDVEAVLDIINGRAPRLNILDCYGNFACVPAGPERVVCEYYCNAEIVHMLGAQGKVVAVDNSLRTLGDYYLQGTEPGSIPSFGNMGMPDYGMTKTLNPDLWLVHGNTVASKQPNTGAAVIGLDLTDLDPDDVRGSGLVRGTLLAGYIFGDVDAAERYVDWVIDTCDMLRGRTAGLSEDQKPSVLYIGYDRYVTDQEDSKVRTWAPGSTLYNAVRMAGAHNVLDDCGFEIGRSASTEIPVSQLAGKRIDFLFVNTVKFLGNGKTDADAPMHGYTADDDTEWYAAHRAVAGLAPFRDIGLEDTYLTAGEFVGNASGGLLNAVRIAAAVHPDLFRGIDAGDVHQRYIDLMGYDFDLSEHGVF